MSTSLAFSFANGYFLNVFGKRKFKKLALTKNIYWTFRLLLLPSSAMIKMQMADGILLSINYMYTICDKTRSRREGV